jgi:GlcNAc-P-P-Und epimerase
MPRQVLITGANGFLGRHIVKAWRDEGAEVTSLGRSDANDIVCDLSSFSPDLGTRTFDIVIHCAGKAHSIPKKDNEVKDIFRANVDGTRNLLRSLGELTNKPERLIFISSVSVYGKDQGVDIDEMTPLKGTTPYAGSKIRAEELVHEWAAENLVAYFNFRLPLIVGVNPPGNLGALSASIERGTYVRIRKNDARKSMVLAGDVAKLTTHLDREAGTYNLTDRVDPEFCEIESAIAESYGKRLRWQIPQSLLKMICQSGNLISLPVNNELYRKLTSSLTFSSDLARRKLGWQPGSCLDFIKNGGLLAEARASKIVQTS